MAAALGGSQIISMAVVPVVVLALLAAAVLLARRLRGNGGLARLAGAPAINIVAARSLGWQSSLLIIEAEGQRFLLASGRVGVSVLGALGPGRTSDPDVSTVKTIAPSR